MISISSSKRIPVPFRSRVRSVLTAALALLLGADAIPASLAGETESKRAGSFEWKTDRPENHGFSTEKLDAMRDELAARNTKIFILIRDDRILYEWYAPDFPPARPHYTASAAKAMIGGLAFAVAMDLVPLDLDERAANYIPAWREDSRKAAITLRQLGSHTSGLSDAENARGGSSGWMSEFWKRLPTPRDPFTLSRDVTPVISEPGAEFHYSNPGIAMFSYAVTAALQNTAYKDLRTLLRERVMEPIGFSSDEWNCGYNQTFEVDGLSLVSSWGGAEFTSRAAVSLGRLMLREGNWEGRQLISAESIRRSTCDSGLPNAVNCGWWTNAQGPIPELPRDAYWAAGAGGQTLLIVPSLRLVMLRNGNRLSDEQNDDALAHHVFAPLMRTQIQP